LCGTWNHTPSICTSKHIILYNTFKVIMARSFNPAKERKNIAMKMMMIAKL
jgi:hypothetical protein